MKKILFAISLILLFLLVLTAFISSSPKNYVTLGYTHSHTKAFCTENNYCQDYSIFCKNEKVVLVSPITGAAIQMPKDWTDPREEETKNELC